VQNKSRNHPVLQLFPRLPTNAD